MNKPRRDAREQLAEQRNLRLPIKLDATLMQFCDRTLRPIPETLRAIVQLFFADGFEAANYRLNRRLWDGNKSATAPETLQGRDDSEYVVTGKETGKRKGRAG